MRGVVAGLLLLSGCGSTVSVVGVNGDRFPGELAWVELWSLEENGPITEADAAEISEAGRFDFDWRGVEHPVGDLAVEVRIDDPGDDCTFAWIQEVGFGGRVRVDLEDLDPNRFTLDCSP